MPDSEIPTLTKDGPSETSMPQTQSSTNPKFQFPFSLNPGAIHLNIPPIIAQTLEMAAAAPPPPIPLISSTNPLNHNSMLMPTTTDIKLNDPLDAESVEHTEKSSQGIEMPNSSQPTEISYGGSSNPTDTEKEYRPLYSFSNPSYQSAIYNQYNSFRPYDMYSLLYPYYYQNNQFQNHKNRTKSKDKSSKKKSTPTKNIVINIS